MGQVDGKKFLGNVPPHLEVAFFFSYCLGTVRQKRKERESVGTAVDAAVANALTLQMLCKHALPLLQGAKLVTLGLTFVLHLETLW